MVAFIAAVALLLAEQVSKIEWGRVLQSLASFSPRVLLAAAGLTIVSHLLFGAYDQLGRRYVGQDLGVGQVAMVAGISYAFNLNLGALVGGVGFRYRLYSRLGLSAPDITKIYALSVVTNWFGYLILLGGVLLWGGVQLPRPWGVPPPVLPAAGVAAWAIAAGYFVLCAVAGGRSITVRGVAIDCPRWPLALAQAGLSIANWLVMGLTVYLLLGGRIEFATVLGVMLISAVAGALTHVPAGLGVLEAVFLALLAGRMPGHELFAGLVAYRAIYYLFPLVPAVILYAGLEARAKR